MQLDDLHAAVLAEPDSDEPRLVYADALQAAGDPRGEFIAIQCELARLGCDRTRLALWGQVSETMPHPRRDWIGDGFVTDDLVRIAALRERERALLAAHAASWVVEPLFEYRFRRGFIDHAYISDMATRDDLFSAAPLLRSMELTQYGAEPFGDARLSQLEQLRFTTREQEERDAFIACAPRLEHLRELAFYPLERELSFPLVELPFLNQLEALELYHHAAEDLDEVLAIARVRDLRLGSLNEPALVLASLASCPQAAQLEILDLSLSGVGEALAPCLASAYLQPLQALRVWEDETRWRGMAGATVQAIAHLPHLRLLDLGGNKFAKRRELAQLCGGLPALHQLGLSGCELDDDDVRTLVSSPLFARLGILDLATNQITDRGVHPFVSARSPSLRVLDLRGNPIGPGTLAELRVRLAPLIVLGDQR